MKNRNIKKPKKANQGPVPNKNFQANKGSNPIMGDEGSAPGNYFKNNPKPDKRK